MPPDCKLDRIAQLQDLSRRELRRIAREYADHPELDTDDHDRDERAIEASD